MAHQRHMVAHDSDERNLADFFENASVGLHWVGPDGILVRANQTELDMLGYRREEYVGHDIAEFHVDRHVIDDILARLARGETLRDYPARMRHKNGSIRDVLISSNVLFEDGRFVHTRCFTRDITEHKRAEEALRESEERFRALADAAPVLIWMSGPNKEGIYFNQPWLMFTGKPAEELMGEGWISLVHPDDRQPLYDLCLEGFRNRKPFTAEFRLRRADGEYRWMLDTGVPRFQPSGAFLGFIGSCVDITDHKQVEEAQGLLAAIVESSNDAIISKSLDGIIQSWNAAAERIFGYSAEQAIGKHISLIIPPERADEEQRIISRLRAGERVDHFETVRIRSDGQPVDVSLTISPVTDDTGRFVGASKVARDITDYKLADAALRESEERLRLSLEAGRMGTWEWSLETNEVLWSPGLEAIHGLEPGTFAGSLEAFQADIHPDDRERVNRSISQTLESGEELRVEYRIIWPDGSLHWVEGRGKLFRNEAGNPVRLIGVCTAITDRKIAENAIRESEERFRHMADAAPVLIWISGTDKKCTWFNQKWLEFTGRSMEQELGYGWADNVHPDDYDRCLQTFATSFDARQAFSLEYRLRHHDGQYRWVLDKGTPQYGPHGEFTGYIGSCVEITERKQAEEALAREQELLQTIIDGIPVMVTLYDPDVRLLRLNREFERVVGWTRAEAAATSIMEECYPDADYREQVRRFMDSCREGWMDIRMRTRDGRDIETSWANIRLSDDTQVGIGIDISERKRAEEAVRESEFRLKALVETAVDGIITIDPRGTVESFNPAAERMFGYRPDEVIGQNVKLLMPHPYQQEHDGYLANYLQTGVAKIIGIGREVTGQRKDGSTFPLELTVSEFEVGGERRFTGFVRDITDRKLAEQALRDSEARFRQLTELMPVAMYTCEAASGVITYYNHQAARLWGRAPQPNDTDQRFCGSFKLFLPDGTYLPHAKCPMAISLREGCEFRNEEVDIERPDGSRITVLVNIDPIRDSSGRVVGAINVFHDVTALKKAEQQLRQADRRKDEFLATLSHELRNPLAPIRHALEVIKRADGDPDLLRQARDTIERQFVQMVRLVDDLLDVSRITRDKLELRKERVELASIIYQAVETCRPLAEGGDQHVEVTLPDEPVYLDADPIRLAQVFSNLVNNACKYTERGGRIWLTAQRQGSDVVVSVKDSGIGIAPEVLPTVFDMFTQADRSLERTAGGLGIGLTLVRRLVEMHGGSIEARSEGPGRGSEFVVRLSVLIEGPATEVPASTAVKPSPTARRILVVDDNRDSATSLAMLLGIAGHQTHTVHDGQEAVQAAEEYRPEVVLLDIGLPKMNGYDVCRTIRQAPWGKEMRIVALTGWGQDDDRRRSQQAGFDGHLVKPVDHGALARLLASDSTEPIGEPAGSG